jgi:DNA-binding NarL/FixJ family response regulator
MSRVRVLLADDHAIVAEGVAQLLSAEFDLVAIVVDGGALVETAQKLQPDVVVADMAMPVLNGLEALKQLRAQASDIKFIFLTMHADPTLAAQALRAGASGYVLKHSAGEELVRAIHEVLVGRVYLTPLITGSALTALARPRPTFEARLTTRQLDVLRLVAEGQTMKEIAAALHISRRTVETHKYEIMQAVGVKTTAELIRYALDHFLVAR